MSQNKCSFEEQQRKKGGKYSRLEGESQAGLKVAHQQSAKPGALGHYSPLHLPSASKPIALMIVSGHVLARH